MQKASRVPNESPFPRSPRFFERHAVSLSASEPSSVFIIKALLYPTVSVCTLLVCLISWGESLYGPYFLVAVMAFAGAADLLDIAPMERTRLSARSIQSLLDITLRWMLVVGFICALLHLSGLSVNFNYKVLFTWAVGTPFVLWLGQLGAQHLLPQVGARYFRARKAVIVGATDVGLQLEKRLRENSLLRTDVLGFFEDRQKERLSPNSLSRILGDMKQLREYLMHHEVDIVYITLPMTRQARILELLESLQDSTASIYFVPDLLICQLMQPRFDSLNGVPVVAVCESPFYGIRGAAKRMMDLLIAGSALLLVSPLMLMVAMGVRISSAGPVIFKQKRYGLDGKEIIVYKFRSLKVMEDGASTYTQVARGDARVTPFGAFIRSTSLDELPQLFNVLEGSMSIVGPRPHAIAVNEQYRRLIPGYMVRHKVKPGITGWAQVNGYRGGDDIESMTKRIASDLEYLRHWSLQLDLFIILKTARLVWKDRHAY